MATKAGMPVDMELKKAFTELQSKMLLTNQQMKVSDAQIETLKRSVQHAALVDREVSKLPENTRMYEGVGRMFIVSSLDNVKTTLDMRIKAAESKIKTIETNKTYLERNMKESEDGLRDLILTKQSRS